MSSYREPAHKDRLSQATLARQKALQAFQKSPARDPAAVEARQERLRVVAEARQEREEQRLLQKMAEEAEQLERQAAEAEAAKLKATELAAAQKAARDARYLARKSRSR